MQACETQSFILDEVKVRVIIQLHLKCRHINITNPISIAQKANIKICIKANNSKQKVKMELFPKGFVLELNARNMDNSPSFLTITNMTLSARRFRGYKILTIDVTAEFCIRTEQWHNGSSISSLGLAETPGVLNTISEDNSVSFLMVH
jgi:hypothetical protein